MSYLRYLNKCLVCKRIDCMRKSCFDRMVENQKRRAIQRARKAKGRKDRWHYDP